MMRPDLKSKIKKMKDIKKILEDHAEWLLDSKKGSRANLSGANLKAYKPK